MYIVSRRYHSPTIGLLALVSLSACATTEDPDALVGDRAGEGFEDPEDVADGLPYEVFAEREDARLRKFGEQTMQMLHGGLVAELGMSEEEVAAGMYAEEDLWALQDKLDEQSWEPETFEDVFGWAAHKPTDPASYWESQGYGDFGQHIAGLSTCAEVVGESGLGRVTPLDWTIQAGNRSNGVLPVNILSGASVAVECRAISPTTPWSKVGRTVPRTRGTWQGFKHGSGAVFTPFSLNGLGFPDRVVSNSTATRSHSVSIELDATNVASTQSYSMICDAVSFTNISEGGQVQGAASYCIDIDVEAADDPCEGARPITVTTTGPGYPVQPGQVFQVGADWSIPSRYTQAGCRDRIDTRIEVSESSWFDYVGSQGRDNGRRVRTNGRRVEMDGGSSLHEFTVQLGTAEDEGEVTLELRDDSGFASGSFHVMKVTIPVDIMQGPEFNTTWSSACPGYDYCWTFAKPIAPGLFTSPAPGETITNTFQVQNLGNGDLDVAAQIPSGMYQSSSPSQLTVPARHVGGGYWENHEDFSVEFTTPQQSDLAQECIRDGTAWLCQEEMVLTTNDSDPGQQQATVLLQTRVTARDVLALLDDQGADLPDVIDFGAIALGETQLTTDPANPQLEQCPSGHFLRQLEVRNDGLHARTHARLLPSTAGNRSGAFLLNGPLNQSLAPGDSMALDLCVLPKAVGHYEELLEIWQSTYPHDSIDVTLRWDGVEPVTVEWAGVQFVDGDTLDFGALSSVLAQSPTDLGLVEITNNFHSDVSIGAYPSQNQSAWNLRGVADADGQSFTPNNFWLLHPGESMSYGLDLLDVSAGLKTGQIHITWGTPTSSNGRQVLGYTPIEEIDVDLQLQVN